MDCISYRGGYRFQLDHDYQVNIPITPDNPQPLDYIDLDADGNLLIRKGYAWDGPSAPGMKIPSFMRASLVHDALYQLMRNSVLDNNHHRIEADRLMRRMCIADGMNRAVAWLSYWAVRKFGNPAADPANKKQSRRAPKACEQS